MRPFNYFIAVILLSSFLGCEMDEPIHPEDTPDLINTEACLSLKSGPIYYDDHGNKYLQLTFSQDTLSHLYSVLFEDGKKYNLSIKGESCITVDLLLLNSQNDTICSGMQGDVGCTRKYITWESTESDTFYIRASYTGEINFHVLDYQITFEELTINQLIWNDLILECSGDWFIDDNNYLALACHNSSYSKWARIANSLPTGYKLAFETGLHSGIPDIYTGVAFKANDEINDMVNLPQYCYEFKLLGPCGWELWRWQGSVSRDMGYTSVSLNRGEGSWNQVEAELSDNSIELSVNSELVRTVASGSDETGLYLTVDDQKNDTVYFRNIEIEEL